MLITARDHQHSGINDNLIVFKIYQQTRKINCFVLVVIESKTIQRRVKCHKSSLQNGED